MILQDFLDDFIYTASYEKVTGINLLYLLGIYFGAGGFFWSIAVLFEKFGWTSRISSAPVPRSQILYEIRHSLVSIFIFAVQGTFTIYLIRQGMIQLAPPTPAHTLFGLLVLTLWNEVHFYLVHRLMHHPYCMRKFHYIHHRSRVPGIYSVYSFHWVEAFLLGTVLLCIAPVVRFSAPALSAFPFVSLVINLSGHSNYRWGHGKGISFLLFATKHHEHHSKGKLTYGFLTPFMDFLFNFHFKNFKK